MGRPENLFGRAPNVALAALGHRRRGLVQEKETGYENEKAFPFSNCHSAGSMTAGPKASNTRHFGVRTCRGGSGFSAKVSGLMIIQRPGTGAYLQVCVVAQAGCPRHSGRDARPAPRPAPRDQEESTLRGFLRHVRSPEVNLAFRALVVTYDLHRIV